MSAFFVYPHTPEKPDFQVPYHRQNATRRWLTHHENSLYLTFIEQNTKDGREKAQCSRELAIAETKKLYWEKHPNFEKDVAQRGAEKLKAQWAGRS